jgi:hypothetical protein
MRRKLVDSIVRLQGLNESASSFPSDRRSANPAAAGGSAQPPARNDNATPSSAAKPDHLPRGVVQGGRSSAIDDLTAAPASSCSSFDDWIEQGFAPRVWQITEPIYEHATIE